MEKIFAPGGLSPLYFMEIAAIYVFTLILFFDQKVYSKHPWLHHGFLILFVLTWLFGLLTESMISSAYGTVMLMSVIIVETLVRRKRRSNLP
jgi:hypothetical protein